MKATSAEIVSFPRDVSKGDPQGRTGHIANAEHSKRQQQGSACVRLTPRQLEVLSLLCEGLPNKLICRRLNICGGTVKVHISCIFRELGVTSRLQAVVAARRLGLHGSARDAESARHDRASKADPLGRDHAATSAPHRLEVAR